MVNTIKFSQFPESNLNDSSTEFVGLGTGANIKSPKVVTWSTANRPLPPFNGVLGLNTDLEQYEFWSSTASVWIQLASSVDLTSTFILEIPDLNLPNSFALSTLATGILKSTTGTGNLSISPSLTSIDGLTTAADEILYTTDSNVYATTSLSPFSRGLLADTNQAAWQAALGVPGLPVNVSQGGTGDVSFTPFSVICGGTTSTNPLQNVVGVGTSGQTLTSNGAGSLPTWQSPSSSGTVNPGLTNELAYYAANGTVISGLATASNGLLITDNSGVPSIGSTIPLPVQLNITELGTITTGTWNGSIIDLVHGGTNANLTASNGGIVYSTASAFAILAGTSTAGLLLQSGASGAPSWSTSTFPGTAGSAGTILRSDGTNWVASTSTFSDTYAASDLLYANGANTIVGLATANNGVLITSSGGIPSISSTLPSAVQLNITSLGTVTLGTWNASTIDVSHGGTGDTSFTAFSVICGGTTSTGALQNVLGVGAIGQVLTSGGPGTLPSWVNAPGTGTINSGNINNIAYYAAAGTTLSGIPTSNNGLVITSNTGVPSILSGSGVTGQVLQSNAAAAPSFSTATYPSVATNAGTLLRADGTNWTATTSTYPNTNAINTLLYASSANVMSALATANSSVLVTSAGGIPSLAKTLPASLTIPSPLITTAIYDTNGNVWLGVTPIASAVNYLAISNSATGTPLAVAASGSDTNIIISISGKGTGNVQISGTKAADNASAGFVGEYVSSNIPNASAITLMANTATDLTSISLTAGDWDIVGNVYFQPTGIIETLVGWMSIASATQPDASNFAVTLTAAAANGIGFCVPTLRVNVSTTTTVYLSVLSSSTPKVSGTIQARRRR